MRPRRPFYGALLLDSELDSNLNCFWPPPQGLEPDQPWTSFLTWKPLLDFLYSIPCTNHGCMHDCHDLITQRPPPGWRRGPPANNNGTRAGHGQSGDELSSRRVTRRPPKQRWGALPATPATRIIECGEGRTAPLTVGRRWSRHRLGAEVPQWRGRCSRRRGPSSLLLPRDGVQVRLPPTVCDAPSTMRRSAPLPPPTRTPHNLPFFPSCGCKQGRGKTPMRRGRWERP
jgi:hypothetical protein